MGNRVKADCCKYYPGPRFLSGLSSAGLDTSLNSAEYKKSAGSGFAANAGDLKSESVEVVVRPQDDERSGPADRAASAMRGHQRVRGQDLVRKGKGDPS